MDTASAPAPARLGQGNIGLQQDIRSMKYCTQAICWVKERLDTSKMGSGKDWTPAKWGQGKIGHQQDGVKEILYTSNMLGQGNIDTRKMGSGKDWTPAKFKVKEILGHQQYAGSRKDWTPAIWSQGKIGQKIPK